MPDRSEISRANGARSHGPITAEGKAISSQNSRTHGLTSAAVVLPHESHDEYEQLELSLKHEYRPQGPLQRDLVQEMAAARWRLRRVQHMESAVFQKAIREQMEKLGPKADPAEAQILAYAAVADSNALRMVTRYAAQFRRAYEKACKELLELQRRNAETTESQSARNEPGKVRFIPETPRSYLDIYNATLPIHQLHSGSEPSQAPVGTDPDRRPHGELA